MAERMTVAQVEAMNDLAGLRGALHDVNMLVAKIAKTHDIALVVRCNFDMPARPVELVLERVIEKGADHG